MSWASDDPTPWPDAEMWRPLSFQPSQNSKLNFFYFNIFELVYNDWSPFFFLVSVGALFPKT